MKQMITVGGSIYAIDCPDSARTEMFKQSVAFCCPYCCYCWCLIQCERHERFWLAPASCQGCNQPNAIHPIPGSILTNIWLNPHVCDEELLSLLPAELVQREFNLALEAVS